MGENANREAMKRVRQAMESGDMETMGRLQLELASDDFVREWPQSGERIRGRENDRKLFEQYPQAAGTTPKFTPGRLLEAADFAVFEGIIDYGDGIPVRMIGVYELKDGKMTKATEYFANPFEAPEWRRGLTEPMKT